MSGAIITGNQIRQRIASQGLITNIPSIQTNGAISNGVSVCGYDATLGPITLAMATNSLTLDPKTMGSKYFAQGAAYKPVCLNAGDTVIAQSVEIFKMPLDLVGIGYERAVYNSFGLDIRMPNLLPGYEGHAQFRITNLTRNGIMLHPGEGIISIMFHLVSFLDGEQGDVYTGKYTNLEKMAIIPPVR